MASPPEQASDWYTIVGSSIGITLVSILGFVAAYFSKRKSEIETTPAGAVASKAVGAAFIDDTVQAAILRLDTNVAAITKLAKDKEQRDRDDDIAERAAERAAEEVERRLKSRKD